MNQLFSQFVSLLVMFHMALGCGWHHGLVIDHCHGASGSGQRNFADKDLASGTLNGSGQKSRKLKARAAISHCCCRAHKLAGKQDQTIRPESLSQDTPLASTDPSVSDPTRSQVPDHPPHSCCHDDRCSLVFSEVDPVDFSDSGRCFLPKLIIAKPFQEILLLSRCSEFKRNKSISAQPVRLYLIQSVLLI